MAKSTFFPTQNAPGTLPVRTMTLRHLLRNMSNTGGERSIVFGNWNLIKSSAASKPRSGKRQRRLNPYSQPPAPLSSSTALLWRAGELRKMTGDEMTFLNFRQFGNGPLTHIFFSRATGVKMATCGRAHRARDIPFQYDPLLGDLRIGDRNG